MQGTVRIQIADLGCLLAERAMAPDEYPAHYKLITSALWSKHPELTIIASGRWGPSVEGSPCLTGQRVSNHHALVAAMPCCLFVSVLRASFAVLLVSRSVAQCDAWDDHYYRTPDQMASMGHQYDDYNRSHTAPLSLPMLSTASLAILC